LNIPQTIVSPTYTIEREYGYQRHRLKGKFLHLDTWRLQNIEELHQLNLQSQLKPKNVIAIEWASRTLKPLLELAKKTNSKIISVEFKPEKAHLNHRKITLKTIN
jgi:tRNA A37 threonylcarbamoyladenosine biosynthesis protein TsaE